MPQDMTGWTALENLGCFVKVEDGVIFEVAMNADGTPDSFEGELNVGQVTAPTPEFLDEVNQIFGTNFKTHEFAGR